MSAPEPYWKDGMLTLYVGDCRDILPELAAEGVRADLILGDPPYNITSLPWDRWPAGWLDAAALVANSMWCFGSLRMFLDRAPEFKSRKAPGRLVWKLSQDIVWEKHNGSNLHADRFRRVHELAALWYRGPWSRVYREVQTTADKTTRARRRKGRPTHDGHLERAAYLSEDGGPRQMRSVMRVRSMHGRAINESEKPVGILDPLITYSCPPGGLVVDPFAGSGAALDAARCTGRRAIGIELRESCAEEAAKRLSQASLFGGAA